MDNETVLISRREVERLTSLAKPTIYRFIAEGKFPRQVRISDNRVAWVRSEVLDWNHKRIEARHRD